jgi:hypothetical protein
MSSKKKWLSVMFVICFVAAAQVAVAETNIDLRMKLGSAAGVDSVEFSNSGTFDTSQSDSGNFQVEAAFTPQQGPGVNFVGTLGAFGRNHKGHMSGPFFPTDVEYSAAGMSGSAGISIAASKKFHFEGRFELAVGVGKPSLTAPFAPGSPTRDGGYAAASLLLGGYFTFSKPGLQLGLELGAQSFVGNFQIWNGGVWEDGKVKGTGGTANLVIGYGF